MADKKLNILFLSGWYPNRILPTLGNFVQKHAEAIAARSNVIALSVSSDPTCKQTIEITENTLNNVYTINVYYKKVTNNIPLFSQLQKSIRTIKAYSEGLKLVKRKFSKIDLVHHNVLYPSGIIALYLKCFKGIPYIITEHSTIYLPSKKASFGLLQKLVSKSISKNASYITPVSNDLKNAMINCGLAGNYEVVYNVVDTTLFYPQEKIKKEKIKFLHVSTLDDPHKNITGMLHAVSRLSKQRNDFEFWFVGDGDTSPHIQTSENLNIYNSFAFFDGTKTTEEIAELMRNADCFVMFSNYENLPVVIIEALASGIPVVSSSVGGIPEHITSEMGILVKPKDELELCETLYKMIDSIKNKRYNPALLSAYAQNNFSYEKVSEKFHQLYDRILKTNV